MGAAAIPGTAGFAVETIALHACPAARNPAARDAVHAGAGVDPLGAGRAGRAVHGAVKPRALAVHGAPDSFRTIDASLTVAGAAGEDTRLSKRALQGGGAGVRAGSGEGASFRADRSRIDASRIRAFGGRLGGRGGSIGLGVAS